MLGQLEEAPCGQVSLPGIYFTAERGGHLSRLVNRYEPMLLSTDADSFDGFTVNRAQRFVQGGYTSLQKVTASHQL